jgi:hypothetical protein
MLRFARYSEAYTSSKTHTAMHKCIHSNPSPEVERRHQNSMVLKIVPDTCVSVQVSYSSPDVNDNIESNPYSTSTCA